MTDEAILKHMADMTAGIVHQLGGRIDEFRTEVQDEIAGLRADNQAFRAEMKSFRAEMTDMDLRLSSGIRDLKSQLEGMEERITSEVHYRKDDDNAAFGDIDTLRKKVRNLDKRVSTLEKAKVGGG